MEIESEAASDDRLSCSVLIMKSVLAVWLLALLSSALCQEFASECPEPDGFFADATQCDKYYACHDNVLTEKICPDGMVFNDLNPRVEKCDFPFHVSCEGRPELQVAKSSENCPRANGYFAHPDEGICDQFFFCSDSIGSQITCPESLAFSLKTGNCVWPDEAGRVGCKSKDGLNFTCPKEVFEVAISHPRYSDPADCQFFFVCINGKSPRRNGCKFGEVFNNETKACDKPINVPDCKDYYREYFEQFFASDEGGSNIVITPDILAAAVGSGFELPNKPKRVKIGGSSAITRRRPADSAAAADTVTIASPKVEPRQPESPQAGRRPQTAGGRPLRRRTSTNSPTTTTTTTTTTTEKAKPAGAVYDDYYYYEDEPAAATTV